ncbi:MAG: DUF362 domain-containing protein [Candidatus Bathyarchaeota archaeon]|nr:MAG: DUF362 domain-containing protein [Candidatus Bathyarchaeota archaeon]
MALFVLAAGLLCGSGRLWGNTQTVVAVTPNQEIQLTLESRNASASPTSEIYVVNGRASAHIGDLVALMGSHGLFFYASDGVGPHQGGSGLIARDDVVLLKINEEWPCRGGTNTDVLKELIQVIVDHPDGFIGEIVVADNGQWQGSMDWPESNAEDITQSTQDVVDLFSPNYNVSTYSWIPIRGTEVDEYVDGDMADGYRLYDTADPETGIHVSYPKFQTTFGTRISFKNGIWNGTGYERRLKVINLPVLKSHGSYGVTASLKHYMGVQSQGEGGGGLANGHSTIATGGMGTLMVETGLPTLNIIDAIWVNANPPSSPFDGPSTPYSHATRVNVLLASIDPVALDYWAAKHVLSQAATLIGYTDIHSIDPDNTNKSGVSNAAFGVWLKLTKDEIIAGGHHATTEETHMNIYVKSEGMPPEIGVPSQTPPKDQVMTGNTVKVSVTVTDADDGVKNVTLSYTINNGTAWNHQTMTLNASTGLYEATIPSQEPGICVKFKIVAYDAAGQVATRDGNDPACTYQVIPEFPSFLITALLVLLTLAAILLLKKKTRLASRT